MAKEKQEEKEMNAFGNFTLLRGEVPIPEEFKEETPADDVDTSTNIVDVDADKVKAAAEAEALARGDKALEKVIEAKIKKVKPEELESDEPNDGEEDEDGGDEGKESLIKVFTKDLYEEGVLDFDDADEDFEDSKTGVSKLVNKTVQNRINKFVESLPPDLNALMQFVQNGGKPKDFMDVYYSNKSWEEIDLENEDNQKLVVSESLRLAGEAEEDIAEIVEEWYDNGTLSKRAKSSQAKLVKHDAAQKAAIIEQQKIKAENERKANEQYWNSLKEDLMKKEEIMGFKVAPKTREKLWDFMTARDPKTGKTAYDEALEEKKDAAWLFALQAMNGFDKSKLEVQTRTKVSNEFGNLLKNYAKSSKDKISAGASDSNYSTNPFEAFKSAK